MDVCVCIYIYQYVCPRLYLHLHLHLPGTQYHEAGFHDLPDPPNVLEDTHYHPHGSDGALVEAGDLVSTSPICG